MDKPYWIRRQDEALAMARAASSGEARLAHYELAGRYSIKAAQCVPFLLAARGAPASPEFQALRLPSPPAHGRPGPSRSGRLV